MSDAWICAACELPNPRALEACRYCGLAEGATPTGTETLVHSFEVQYTQGAFERLDVWNQFECDAEVQARAGYVPTRQRYHEGGGPRPLLARWLRPFGYRPYAWDRSWHLLRWLLRSGPAVALTVEYTLEDDLPKGARAPSTKAVASGSAPGSRTARRSAPP